MNWQIGIFIALVTASFIASLLVLFAHRKREASGVQYFQLLMGAVALWSASYLFELAADDPTMKEFWGRLKYLGVVSVPVCWFSFDILYVGRIPFLRMRHLLVLLLIPVITILLVWTNNFHGFIWKKIWLESIGAITLRVPLYGPWYWVQTAYSYLLVIAGSLLLVIHTLRANDLYRGQVSALLIAVLAPFAGSALYLWGPKSLPPIDFTPLGFVVTGIALAYSLNRQRLLDILPIAHDLLFKNMSDIAFVLDIRNRVVDLNARTRELLAERSIGAIGKPAKVVFKEWGELLQTYEDSYNVRAEISIPVYDQLYYFDLNISSLVNGRGALIGRLIVLHDITHHKQAENKLQKTHEELEQRIQERTRELQVINQRLWEEIQDRRKTQDILTESEERYRQLVEQPFDGVYVHREGTIIYINSTGVKLLGAEKAGDLIGLSIFAFIHPDYKDFVQNRVRQIRGQGGTVALAEEKFIRMDGKELVVEVAATALQYEGLPSILSVFRDITDRKLAEDQLREAKEELETRVQERTAALEKVNSTLQTEIHERERIEEELRKAKNLAEASSQAKSEFLANMSHELRTPLNAIIGFSELILDREYGEINAVQEEYLGDVLQSSRHLLSLINDILDLSKIESGKLELNVSAFDLRALLENSLVMVKEKAMKHGLQIHTQWDGIPESIQADERKLKQILYNLLSNAVKFTPDGGAISFSAVLLKDRIDPAIEKEGERPGLTFPVPVTGDWVEVSVQDTGIGIKKEDLERIFAPFEQVDNSASRRFQGTGLGLSVTRQLVELHGGRVWVESEGLSLGSRFIFRIPLKTEHRSGEV